MSSTPPVRMRRRGAALEAAILDAGWEQLSEFGYEGFTMEAVAERSSSARSVLYRRWPSRFELLEAAIRRRSIIDALAVPDTGNLRDDLLALLNEFNLRRLPIVGVLAAGFTTYYREAGKSPLELLGWLRREGPNPMELVVLHAVERGELIEMPSPRIVMLPIDLLRHELFMTMKPASQDTIVDIVDNVFLPLATNSGRSSEGGSRNGSKH